MMCYFKYSGLYAAAILSLFLNAYLIVILLLFFKIDVIFLFVVLLCAYLPVGLRADDPAAGAFIVEQRIGFIGVTDVSIDVD